MQFSAFHHSSKYLKDRNLRSSNISSYRVTDSQVLNLNGQLLLCSNNLYQKLAIDIVYRLISRLTYFKKLYNQIVLLLMPFP